MSQREKRRQALGRRLRFEREAIDMTREDLASKVGVDAMLVKRWELGRTRIPAEILTELADALGVKVERLLAISLQQPGRSAQARAA